MTDVCPCCGQETLVYCKAGNFHARFGNIVVSSSWEASYFCFWCNKTFPATDFTAQMRLET